MEAFLLGLSNGGVCLAYCAPVLVPCYGRRRRDGGKCRRAPPVPLRQAGRISYFWRCGLGSQCVAFERRLQDARLRLRLHGPCHCPRPLRFFRYRPVLGASCRWASRLAASPAACAFLPCPLGAGLATGLSLCPPFLLAMAGSAEKGSLSYSLFFFMFFLGHVRLSLSLRPCWAASRLSRREDCRSARRRPHGRLLLFYGVIMLAGGIKGL